MGNSKIRKALQSRPSTMGVGFSDASKNSQKLHIEKLRRANVANKPSTFLPDFGLAVAAQVLDTPFKLQVFTLKGLRDPIGKKAANITFGSESYAISSVENQSIPILSEGGYCFTLEVVLDSELDAYPELYRSLGKGLEVFANWDARYTVKRGFFDELVVPLHLTEDQCAVLGIPFLTAY